MKADLLLEIGTEELPSKALNAVITQMGSLAESLLGELGLAHGPIKATGTPRRLFLHVKDLEGEQPDRLVEAKGPSKKVAFDDDGSPTKAAIGFAKGQNIDPAKLQVRETGQGEYVFAVQTVAGRATKDLLADVLVELISGISFAKSMRWGSGELRFSRPIRWLLAVYGQSRIDFSIDGIKSGNLTYGHRFLSKDHYEISGIDDYYDAMADGHVIVDIDERMGKIKTMVHEVARGQNAKAVVHDNVLEEVVNLVENPGALCGTFDSQYLALPREVLETAMESHQRYFPIEDDKGDLAAGFITIHNGDPAHADIIRRGNERVLRARLADAKFFFEEDLKKGLPQRVEQLKDVIFQEKLGTVFDKAVRTVTIAGFIADKLDLDDDKKASIDRAAQLLKADLVTSMVIEFPTLQGVMGREYAGRGGESQEVAQAIYEHYQPRFAGDELPQSTTGAIVSMADKFDTIAGCLAIGLMPTGSQDPYMLRRFARGIIDIVRANDYRFSLIDVFEKAVGLLERAGAKIEVENVRAQFVEFMTGRVKQYLLQAGLAYDTVDAVLELGVDDIVDIIDRTKALEAFRDMEDMDSLLVGFLRCRNLSKGISRQEIDKSLFVEDDERILFEDLARVNLKLDEHLAAEDYGSAMQDLALLRTVVDGFFDRVLVMTDDVSVKENRLNLLRYGVETFDRIADFSKIVVAGGQEKAEP